MAVNLSPIWGAGAQLLDNSGNVLSGGKIYTYAAGTTTPAATYTSSNGITANSNPIILNSAGRVPYEIWLTDGVVYKFVLKDSNDTLIATYDNLVGINSNYIAFTMQQEIQTATAGQTVFNLTTMQYQPGTNSLSVYVDGVNQYGPGAQYAYVETDSDTVTFVNGLHVGASVKFTTAASVSSNYANAAQVTYDPPFTGAVATNVEAKLSETVSVKDFGAVGDGVTDDTAAIQAALDSGEAEIYFPIGTYVVTSLDITNSIRLFGVGVLEKTSVTGTSMLNITVGNVEVDGLTFHGASVDTTIPTTNSADNAITIDGGSTPTQIQNIKIRNCTINGVAGFGIRVNYATNVWVQNNNVSYCGYAGILGLSVIHGIIDGNRVTHIDSVSGGPQWYGISLTREPTLDTTTSARSADCVITNNVVSYVSQWTGIDIHAGYKIVVDSNQIYKCKNGTYAQYDSSVATYKQPSEYITFSNNIIEGNTAASTSALGIASLGMSGMPNKNIIITGNQVINGGGYASTNGGLYIYYTNNATISNNSVKNSWRTTFSVSGVCDTIVFDTNEFNGVQPDGSGSSTYYGYITNTSMTNVVFRNNRFLNNSGTSVNSPTYGILYSSGTYSGITFDKNRMSDLTTTSYLYNGTNSNRYQDFVFLLEPTSAYNAGWTLTASNTTETYDVTISRNVYGTTATNSLFYATDRTTVANPKVFVRTTGQVNNNIYRLTAFTSDGTTFGSATNIPVMLTVNGICWTD